MFLPHISNKKLKMFQRFITHARSGMSRVIGFVCLLFSVTILHAHLCTHILVSLFSGFRFSLAQHSAYLTSGFQE